MDESAPCTIMAQFGALADLSVERASPFVPPVGATHYGDRDDPIRADVKINSPCHWNNARCIGCTRKVVP